MIAGSSISGASVAGDASKMRTVVIRLSPMDSTFIMPDVTPAGGASFSIEPIDSNFDMPDIEQMTVTFVQLVPIDSEFEMPDVFSGGGASFNISPIDSDFDMPDSDIVIVIEGIPDWYPQLVAGDAVITIKNRENKTVQIFRADDFNNELESFDFTQNDTFTDATVTAGRYKYVLRFVGRFEGTVISEGQKSISKYLRK